MKILMLGWEFPPHISGGLGTACAGLTQALERQGIDVLLVVPKLHGDEKAERTTFISASSIPIRQQKIALHNEPESVAENSSISRVLSGRHHSMREKKVTHTTVEIPSPLSPYTPTSTSEGIYSIQQWNYSFGVEKEQIASAEPSMKTSSHSPEPRRQDYEEKPYPFTGTYGANLLEEVERYAQAAAEIARSNSFDVIHAHDWMTYKAGLEVKKISGKPLVLHVHATEIDRSGSSVNAAVFSIERQGMQFTDRIVTVSHWTKNIAIQHYNVPANKIEVIHNGVNPRAISNESKISSPFGSQIVTFLGRITHQKGPLYFVEAARKVHEKFPEAHFIVAGSGDQMPLMIERIAQLRLSNHIHFTGFLKGEDIDKVWAMSDVYVMPSVSEPFGIAPLEAIQAGVPVILSKQAGVSEVMPHAIKVDFWNSEAFAEAICNVLRFKSLANTLMKNSAEEIKNITWDKAAKKLTTLYYELSTKREKRKKPDSLFPSTSTKTLARSSVL